MNATEKRGEVKTTEACWRELTEQFGEKGFCMLCDKEISEHRHAAHTFVPKIQIDEEIADERTLKRIAYYLCFNRNELYLKRVTHPDKALLNGGYTVYERISREPLWLQKALISSGRLRNFLELAIEGEDHEERRGKIGELIEGLSSRSGSEADGTEVRVKDMSELIAAIGESAESIWRRTHAVSECVSFVELAFGDERHCRICGREEELHDKGDHTFVPKIGAVKDVVDKRAVMREEQYLCIHENRLCIKRVMSGASGENVSYETSLPPWEYEFSEALFARGRILEFLEFVNDRLSKERREHEQIAECVKRISKQGSQDVFAASKT